MPKKKESPAVEAAGKLITTTMEEQVGLTFEDVLTWSPVCQMRAKVICSIGHYFGINQ